LKHFGDGAVARANFERPKRSSSEGTMKKMIKVFAVVAVASMLFSACSSTHACPAYGKVVKPSAARNS
jgi:hypothetical protein